MTVTCVGIGADAKAASGNAVAQWVLGVLPVVARWRGGHSCLAGPEEPVILRGQFDLISGPVVSRGSDSSGAVPAEHVTDFSDKLVEAMSSKKLANRIHWLETFAVRHQDGTVDATCRLNNHDWNKGRSILIDLAAGWPVPQAAMTTCRQFTMLIPRDGTTQDLIAPSFWNRLLGSA